MSFTDGRTRNKYAAIYDRLRKRSLRSERALDAIYTTVPHSAEWGTKDEFDAAMAIMDAIERRQYGTTTPTPHEAYVRGVRDALGAASEVE